MPMRIDCHVHGNPNELKGDPKAYVAACRKRGIEAIVLIEDLDVCLEAVKKFGDFVIPCARIKMDAAGPSEIEHCIEAGAKAIKFIRPAAPYGDDRYFPLYDKLEQMGKPAIFHTGYLGFRNREEQPVRFEYMRAAQVEAISRRCPDLKILMSHYSNPWWEEAWKVSWTKKNVFADLSGGTAVHRSIRMWADLFAPDGELFEESITKLCFGSDVHYFLDDQYPFEPYLTFHDKIYDAIGLSAQLREKVNRGNILKLFGM